MFVLVVFFVLEILTLVILIKRFIATRKKSIFSFRNAELLGGIIFMSFATTLTIITASLSIGDGDDVLLNISGTLATIGQIFSFCAIPFLVILFGFFVVSNIVLIIRTGFGVKKLLGAIIGTFLIGCTFLIIYGWDYVYADVVQPLLMAGKQWIIVFDIAIPLFLSGVICYIEAIMIGLMIYGLKAARNKPKYDKDVIVILGCGINKDGTPSVILQRRLDCALAFAKKQEEANGKKVIFMPSGGKGNDEVISEAESMRNYLVEHGIPLEQIVMEDKSTSTYENLVFSKELIGQINPQANVLVCTNNFHVYRGCIYARYVGLDAEGIGSNTKWYYWPNAFLRELVALFMATLNKHITMVLFILVISFVLGGLYYYAVMR